MDDVVALRPTIFVAVPRILERVEDGGEAGLRGWPAWSAPWRATPQPARSARQARHALPAKGPAPPLPLPAVRAKLRKAGRLQQAVFSAAFAYKRFLLSQGLPYR